MEVKEKKVVYLLGAGFSHAITDNNAPSTKDLGTRLGALFPPSIKEKYNFSPENIELFLTKIDLDLLENKENNKKIETARFKVTETLYQIFKTSNFCSNTKAGIDVSDTAKKVVGLLFRENDAILTLNYDCYLENLLALNGKWDPYTGYGEYLTRKHQGEEKKKILNIYKLHGSVNFHTVVKSIDKKTGITETDIDFEINSSGDNFPKLDFYCEARGSIQEYFIAPSYLKQFNYKGILQIWKEAALKIQQADVLIIMGCSLRNEDYPLIFLISQISNHVEIFIIDLQAEKITKRLQTILPIDPNNIKFLGKEINNLTEKQVSQIYL